MSQDNNNQWFGQYNQNIENGKLNLMINSVPVFNITLLSRPLLWGFVLFGMEYGYSWYWSMKMILLILFSFDPDLIDIFFLFTILSYFSNIVLFDT